MTDKTVEMKDARTAPVAVWQLLDGLKGDALKEWRVAEVTNRNSIKDRQLDRPFPFGWYPVLQSSELDVGVVKPLRAFGTDYAIWRGESGKTYISDAYCRHLGAHMGYGGRVVNGENLECPFHAWEYDSNNGTVVDIPYSKSIPPQVKREGVSTHPTEEANGFIWMWYHPQGVAPLFEVAHIPEATDPNWAISEEHEWNVWNALQNIAENGVDFAHFKYIHGTASFPTAETRWGKYDRGAVIKAKMGTPKGEVEGTIAYENIGPGQAWVRFTGICETLLLAAIVPVEQDRVHARYYFMQPKEQITGPKAGLARAIIKDICKQFDQDKVVWDRQRHEPNPIICQGDGPIAQFRQFYAQFYAEPTNDPEGAKLEAAE